MLAALSAEPIYYCNEKKHVPNDYQVCPLCPLCYLCGDVFVRLGSDARHEVCGDECTDDDRVLAAGLVGHGVTVEVERHHDHRHLA